MGRTELWGDIVTSDLAIALFVPYKNELKVFDLKEQNVIGRESHGTQLDIPIDSPVVSRRHGKIYTSDDYYFYEDLESTNGTYINGVLYGRESEIGKYKYLLRVGDVLRIDHRDLINPHKNAALLVAIHSDKERIIHKLVELNHSESIVIGRNLGNLKIENKAISERHAAFVYENGAWFIEDLNSTNGVFVNNKQIDIKQALNMLDVIRIADYVFIFNGNKLLYFCDDEDSKRLIIKIEERSVKKLFNKQILLQDINLSINEGEMVMILGGSGAGKTTFVNAVMGYEKAIGTIEHNNIDIYKDYNKVKNEIGFVPQQDLLRLEDTVYATLANAADMKMGTKSTKSEREQRIEYVLNCLGLSREKDSGVKKLSGGQRKRLSIAVELISNPSLFILDEPDSGLDGIMAKSLMEQLRDIADEGKIVMVITHAPDRVRELFDKVVILAKGEMDNIGHLAYFGSVNGALDFFEADSLEGVVKRINRVDEGGDGLSDHFIEKYKLYSGGNNK